MIGIIVALKSESEELLKKAENVKEFKVLDKKAYSGKIENKDFILVISGIGKVSAALTTQVVIDKFRPEYVLNFGTCGGMNNDVKVLNYYAIEKCCQYDFDLTDLEDVPLGYIQEYDTVFFPSSTSGLDFLEKSTLASADKFTSKEKDVLTINSLGCSICDMEGAAIAQVCLSNKIPLVIIKGISDVYGSGVESEQFFRNLKTVGQGFPSIIKKVINNIKF